MSTSVSNSTSNSLHNWLQSAGLHHLIPVFDNHGVTESNFVELQFQNYDAMGIVDPPSRQKLFRLIQLVKRENANAAAAMQSAVPTPSSIATSTSTSTPTSAATTATATSTSLANRSTVANLANRANSVSSISSVSQSSATASAGSSVSSTSSAPASASASASASRIAAPISRIARTSSNTSYQPAEVQSSALSPIQLHDPDSSEPSSVREREEKRNNNLNVIPSSNNNSNVRSDSYIQESDVEYDDNDENIDGDEVGDENDIDNLSFENDDRIRVAVRKRPLNTKERNRGENDIATVDTHRNMVTIHESKQKVDLTRYVESHTFAFDLSFNDTSTNEQIYSSTCKPLIPFFLNKGKATCFAYGQTGSGKTFTMMGSGDVNDSSNAGLYVMAAKDIFKLINSNDKYSSLQVWVSFFEIYGGKLYDLLNDRAKLVSREDGMKSVNIVGLTETRCSNVQELLDILSHGNGVRSTGSTGANIDSSRSHAILQIAVKKVVQAPGTRPKLKTHGKFSFIDLAGSERGSDVADNDRRTRLEGAEINKSLLALKECIRALDQGGKHLPFRGSQLTQVLKDSFTGNSRTIMIANISPNSQSCEHTLNTLRYADRVKELKKSQSGGSAQKSNVDAYMPHKGGRGNRKIHGADFVLPSEREQFEEPIQQHQPQYSTANREREREREREKEREKERMERPFVAPLAQRDTIADATAEDGEDDLMRSHNELALSILAEEEQMMEIHRTSIDTAMKIVKEEMELLKQFDCQGCNVDEYVDRLDELLEHKFASLNELRSKLSTFKSHLREEETLSSTINKQHMHPNAGRKEDRMSRNESKYTVQPPHLQPMNPKRTDQYR